MLWPNKIYTIHNRTNRSLIDNNIVPKEDPFLIYNSINYFKSTFLNTIFKFENEILKTEILKKIEINEF